MEHLVDSINPVSKSGSSVTLTGGSITIDLSNGEVRSEEAMGFQRSVVVHSERKGIFDAHLQRSTSVNGRHARDSCVRQTNQPPRANASRTQTHEHANVRILA